MCPLLCELTAPNPQLQSRQLGCPEYYASLPELVPNPRELSTLRLELIYSHSHNYRRKRFTDPTVFFEIRSMSVCFGRGFSTQHAQQIHFPPWPNSLWQPRALSFCIRFNFTVASKKSGHLNMLSMNIHGLHMCALYIFIRLDTYLLVYIMYQNIYMIIYIYLKLLYIIYCITDCTVHIYQSTFNNNHLIHNWVRFSSLKWYDILQCVCVCVLGGNQQLNDRFWVSNITWNLCQKRSCLWKFSKSPEIRHEVFLGGCFCWVFSGVNSTATTFWHWMQKTTCTALHLENSKNWRSVVLGRHIQSPMCFSNSKQNGGGNKL